MGTAFGAVDAVPRELSRVSTKVSSFPSHCNFNGPLIDRMIRLLCFCNSLFIVSVDDVSSDQRQAAPHLCWRCYFSSQIQTYSSMSLLTMLLLIIGKQRHISIEDVTSRHRYITSCVLSRLDYCSSFLIDTPSSVIQPMQKVQNMLHALFSELHAIKTAHLSYSNSTGSQFLNE